MLTPAMELRVKVLVPSTKAATATWMRLLQPSARHRFSSSPSQLDRPSARSSSSAFDRAIPRELFTWRDGSGFL
jgi:hypothetical protein